MMERDGLINIAALFLIAIIFGVGLALPTLVVLAILGVLP
jgi:hypothetical protein